MENDLTPVYESIDRAHADESAHTRRKMVALTAGTIGSLGLLGLPNIAKATGAMASANTPQNILNIAATAEVLATIVNTVGPEKIKLDRTTRRNVEAAAREELIHYDVLRSVGAKPLTKKIWIPDAVFASRENFLNTLVVGDQIFINAYLIGVTAFAKAGKGFESRFAAETMGAEAVHRALARQSLGKLGNDRVFMEYKFTKIDRAAELLQKAGFGFGKRGKGPGAFYQFDRVKKRTPNPKGVNTRKPA